VKIFKKAKIAKMKTKCKIFPITKLNSREILKFLTNK